MKELREISFFSNIKQNFFHVFSCKFYKISSSSLFTELLLMVASFCWVVWENTSATICSLCLYIKEFQEIFQLTINFHLKDWLLGNCFFIFVKLLHFSFLGNRYLQILKVVILTAHKRNYNWINNTIRVNNKVKSKLKRSLNEKIIILRFLHMTNIGKKIKLKKMALFFR